MNFTRRDIGRLALAALPAATLLAKPNSRFAGVQVGVNAPYSFHGMPSTADDVQKYLVQLGLSAVELRSQPVEAFLGAPAATVAFPPVPMGKPPASPADALAARRALAEELRKWRLSQSLDRFKTFRKKYEDAGILIQVVKFDGVDSMTGDEVDYAFQMAKMLGAGAISCEIPLSKTKWLGGFADKHKLMVGYHGHSNLTNPEAFAKPESWETAFSHAKYNGANIDLGHFIAANNVSPAGFIEKYHDRITHVHVKDRKMNNGPNTPFGQGDTPIKEVLRMMRDKKYAFQATIEFEYRVPEGSTVMAEMAKCVQYCKDALA